MYSYMFMLQMNGMANGDMGLALQGLTVQGSNSNPDNRIVEEPSKKMRVVRFIDGIHYIAVITADLPVMKYCRSDRHVR